MAKPTTQIIKPQPGPQEMFLASTADICVYGGGAGGGKTYGLLLEPLRNIANPRFGAVIFRRESPQITNEGGLWDEASQIYPLLGGEARIGELDYRFTINGKPGGKVTFRHLQREKNKYNWQGAQVPLICFDELTHFSESQFFYMLSRNRSVCGVRPYVRATCNPDAGSWVKRFLSPWVDRKYKGKKAASGELRWMIRVKGEFLWGDSKGDLEARFPGCRPKSITFIKATVFDNPKLLEKDPDYLANLEMQSVVERARLLLADWDVVSEGLVYPDFGTIVVEVEDWPAVLAGKRVGGLDWGFRDPFAAVLGTEDHRQALNVDWCHLQPRMTPTEISQALPRGEDLQPRWWADPSGAAMIAELRAADHDVIACAHQGSNPIKDGIAVVTERIKDRTLIVRGDCGDLIDEAGKYRYPEPGQGRPEVPLDRDNHLMDALRYLVVGNDRGRVVKDRRPEASEETKAAEAMRRIELREQQEREFYDIDNEHWWA